MLGVGCQNRRSGPLFSIPNTTGKLRADCISVNSTTRKSLVAHLGKCNFPLQLTFCVPKSTTSCYLGLSCGFTNHVDSTMLGYDFLVPWVSNLHSTPRPLALYFKTNNYSPMPSLGFLTCTTSHI